MTAIDTKSETFDLVIKNGTIVTADTTYQADIGVRGETIVAIGQKLIGTRQIDASGKLVTPGAVDIHVHMQMPIGGGICSSDDFLENRFYPIYSIKEKIDNCSGKCNFFLSESIKE